jgi:hypothetical protein
METTASKTTSFTGNPEDYTHNFGQRIGDQNAKVESQYGQYATDQAAAQSQRDAYQQAFANQTGYGDLLNTAEGKYGVDDRRGGYEQSMRAIAATNQAMNALPSTINANSERVLTQAQRNAALGNQMNKYQNTLSSWQQQNATDAAMYQAAMNEARNLASQNMAQEQYKLGMQQSDWQTLLNQAAQTYNQALNEQNIRNAIYQQMYDDEAQHRQLEYNYWAKRLDDENAKRQLAIQEAQAAAQKSYQDYMMSLNNNKSSGNTFSDYLLSNASLDQSGVGGWAEGMNDQDKANYLNDMLVRWNSGDAAERQRIMEGSTYRDYLNRLRGSY